MEERHLSFLKPDGSKCSDAEAKYIEDIRVYLKLPKHEAQIPVSVNNLIAYGIEFLSENPTFVRTLINEMRISELEANVVKLHEYRKNTDKFVGLQYEEEAP